LVGNLQEIPGKIARLVRSKAEIGIDAEVLVLVRPVDVKPNVRQPMPLPVGLHGDSGAVPGVLKGQWGSTVF
jgi:hypothetical protein